MGTSRSAGIPMHPEVIIASPCSGHGFKFAPAIGELLAGLALGEPPRFDIDLFRLDRLWRRRGTPYHSARGSIAFWGNNIPFGDRRMAPTTQLNITDSRTDKAAPIAITDGAIRASDLKQFNTGGDDPGLMSYDPGVPEHGVVPQRDHVHRRRQGDPALSRLSDRAARGEGDVPRSRVAAAARRAADAEGVRPVGARHHVPHVRAREHQAASCKGSATTRIRCRCSAAPSRRSRRSIRRRRTSSIRWSATSRSCG